MLHVEFVQHNKKKVIELCALNKVNVDKAKLLNVDPDPDAILEAKGVQILQGWLAARYKRAAFPDDLNTRMEPMKKGLESVGKSGPNSILGIWIKYSPEDNHLSNDVPYELWIKIVYKSQVYQAKDKAEQEAIKLRSIFEKKLLHDGVWQSIDLRACEAVSDAAFTSLDISEHDQWRLEHLSLRQDPPGDFI
jgi:hypothetical protein